MVLPLDGAGIAGSHSCVCNKARSKWAPDDWCVARLLGLSSEHELRREEFCPYSAPDQAISLSDASPRTHKLLNSGVVPLRPSRDTFDALVHHLSVSPNVAKWLCPDQDLMSDYFGVRGRLVLPLSFNAIKTARSWSVVTMLLTRDSRRSGTRNTGRTTRCTSSTVRGSGVDLLLIDRTQISSTSRGIIVRRATPATRSPTDGGGMRLSGCTSWPTATPRAPSSRLISRLPRRRRADEHSNYV